MKATASQKIRIGIFTVAGLLILIAGIFAIGNQKYMFGERFSIYGTFKNISGLQIGNNVRFAGLNVGTVTGITIENDSTIRATMRIKGSIHKFLKDDATASIGTDGLMGDKLINISPGLSGNKLIEKGGQIKTINPVEYDKIINKISSVADNAEIITSSLAGIATQINSGKGSIGRLIYSDTLEKGLEHTVKAAKEGVNGFQQNMNAMQNNFLLKGYFKKKRREERRNERKLKNQQVTDTTSK
jgi:phospholipid/cholesterol/gamma-HCH transport system substrate-binding protein